MQRTYCSGFTLIELVMSLFVLGLVSGAIILTLPATAVPERSEAQRLAERLNAAANHSILSGEVLGAALSQSGYSFHRLVRGQWSKINESPLAEWNMSPDSGVTMSGSGAEIELWPSQILTPANDVRPNFVFYPVGLNTPFSISVRGENESLEVRSNGAGDISVVRPDVS